MTYEPTPKLPEPRFSYGEIVTYNGNGSAVRIVGKMFGTEPRSGEIVWKYFVQPADRQPSFPVECGDWVAESALEPHKPEKGKTDGPR